MESVGIEGVAGSRSGWHMPKALAVMWVIKEKNNCPLLCLVFFLATGESCCSRGCNEIDKKISKKEKEVECLDRIFGSWVAG